MHIQTADVTRDAVAAAVRRFEQATGAKVDNQADKNEQFKQNIAIALPSGSPPDVFHTWGGGGLADHVKTGLVAPVPDDFSTAGIRPTVLALCQVGGKLYAVPTGVSVVAFWYRKSLFSEHAIAVPTSLAELTQACMKLRRAGVSPIALGNVAHWPGAFYFDYLVLRQGGAAEYISKSNAGGGPADTPAARTAGELIRALVQANAFIDGFGGLNYGQSRAAFFKGDAAITLMGSWLLSYAISDRPEVVDDLGLFAFPALDKGPDAASVLGGTNAAYAVSAKSKHKDLAFKLVQFLSDEAAAQGWAEAKRIPAREVDLPNAAPVLAQSLQLLEAAPRLQLYYDQALEPAVAEKHKPQTQLLFARETASVGWRVAVGAGVLVVLVVLGFVLRAAFRSGE